MKGKYKYILNFEIKIFYPDIPQQQFEQVKKLQERNVYVGFPLTVYLHSVLTTLVVLHSKKNSLGKTGFKHGELFSGDKGKVMLPYDLIT